MTFNPLLHDRDTTGAFTAMNHSDPELLLRPEVLCSECGEHRARGTVHRCPAPGLITLSTATEKVLAACRAAGGRPLIVGGSVRDALISKAADKRTEPHDIDIEVYGVPTYEPLLAQLTRIGRVDLTGAKFTVLKAKVDGEDFDVALPRIDSKTGLGHREFAIVSDADLGEVEAFARRDYTVNAMGWDSETGELVDPWGGTADLAAGILRHPTAAYAEDPLRVIRGIRFAAQFGLEMAPETVELARSISDRFPDISTERVWGEWQKIARTGTSITSALRVLESTGWLRHFPGLAATHGWPQDPIWHPEGDVFTHLGFAADIAAANAERDGLSDEDREVAVFGALVHDLGKPVSTQFTLGDGGVERITSQGHDDAGVPVAREFLEGIGAPIDLVNRVLPLVAEHMCHTSGLDRAPAPAVVRRLIRRLADGNSGATIADWAWVVDADCAGRGPGAKESPSALWLEVSERVGPTPRKGILNAGHLMSAGWKPEPAFAFVIRAAIDAQDDGVIFDEASAIAWFEAHGPAIRTANPPVVPETKDERKARLRAAKIARREELAAEAGA